jgi:hypothetical protein
VCKGMYVVEALCSTCDFVEGAKCRDKRFWLCAFDLVLEGRRRI